MNIQRTNGREDLLTVYTVGHSDHDIERFIEILKQSGVTAVADVRSVPYSRFHNQFNKHELHAKLKEYGIQYVFLGHLLGARPSNPDCYNDGVAEYELIARSNDFQQGIDRVIHGAHDYTIALMCAEKDPLDCHRNVLVAHTLSERGVRIRHILYDGSVEENTETEDRLMKLTKHNHLDMFSDNSLEQAYKKRAQEICYRESKEDDEKEVAVG